MLLLPKNLLDLVEEAGGGGFWICEAVGARDWRMEYVRCIVAVVVVCGVGCCVNATEAMGLWRIYHG
ncbi:hypothetical protein Tdes44962_MAKER03335 [Teratosphaeria destructans]|uniref:Uncharacterized protein n=1 Tax=Teratosphaeria destructans TaxID=418781 RepID=A0A9W7SQC7_9PEZI|nr:hypothetical protein Tdes44962_MAKER03335 [Teratosphaeria destructans]